MEGAGVKRASTRGRVLNCWSGASRVRLCAWPSPSGEEPDGPVTGVHVLALQDSVFAQALANNNSAAPWKVSWALDPEAEVLTGF